MLLFFVLSFCVVSVRWPSSATTITPRASTSTVEVLNKFWSMWLGFFHIKWLTSLFSFGFLEWDGKTGCKSEWKWCRSNSSRYYRPRLWSRCDCCGDHFWGSAWSSSWHCMKTYLCYLCLIFDVWVFLVYWWMRNFFVQNDLSSYVFKNVSASGR